MDLAAAKNFTSSWSFFWKNYRKRTIATIVASIALSVLELFGVSMILPLFSVGFEASTMPDMPFVKYVQTAFEWLSLDMTLNVLFLIFMGVWVMKSFVTLGLNLFVNNSMILIVKDLRNRVILSLRGVAWPYFNTLGRGEIINLMTQETERCGGIFSTLHTVIVSTLMFVVYLFVGVSVSYEILVILVLLSAVGLLLARPMFRMARKAGVGELEGLKDIASDLLQGVSGLKTYKAMGREKNLLMALSSANDSFVDANKLKVKAQNFLSFSQEMVFAIAAIFAFVVVHGVMNYPLVEIGFMGYVLLKLNTHLTNLLKKFQAVSTLHYAVEKYQERLSGFGNNIEKYEGKNDYTYPAEIEYKNVSFLHGSVGGVKNANLTLPEKGITLFAGPSGSGKTTLIDLLCGFYEPTEGHILIGGHDFQDLNFWHWRKYIGYVTQSPILLDDTIANNVAAFNDDVTEEDIWKALEHSGIAFFVKSLPGQLETRVGEEGSRMSGGEKQRLALARALAQKPKLLILDEPTAALDTAIEAEIIQTVRKLGNEICVVVVSHQPAWVHAADHIFDITEGKVMQRMRS